MTEQPNTDAIREGSAAFPDDLLWHRTQTLALCDALDAARAEVLDAREMIRLGELAEDREAARAEAAEGNLERTITHLRGVNLRIAAAVVELDESISVGTGAYLMLAERIRAILLPEETP